METEQLQMVFDKLDQLSLKLGVAAEHIWPWFIRQQYVEAFLPLILMVIFFIASIGLIILLNKVGKFDSCGEADNVITTVLMITAGLSTCITLISFTVTVVEIGDVFNVEYAALRDIINLVK